MAADIFGISTQPPEAPLRRRLLLLLGGAGLAMVARPSAADAASKARKRCRKDKKQCRNLIQDHCDGTLDEEACLDALLPCCGTCNFGVGVVCVLNEL